jgi:DNA-binding response OmpR family regulator
MDDYVTKPFNHNDVLTAIRRIGTLDSTPAADQKT